MSISGRHYKDFKRILLKYYKDILHIGGTDTTLPWVDMTSHCHLCIGHPTSTGGKDSPLRLVARAPHYHWWEGQPLAIGGKGISLPLVGRAPDCYLVVRASQLRFRRRF